MLLLNVVFCVIAGSFYWASQVPVISDEISAALGTRSSGSASDSRAAHMIFLMFTYCAPLLLAGTLATLHSIRKKITGAGQKRLVTKDALSD